MDNITSFPNGGRSQFRDTIKPSNKAGDGEKMDVEYITRKEFQDEMKAMRQENDKAHQEFREDMKGLRKDFYNETTALRKDFFDQMTALRKDVTVEMTSIRNWIIGILGTFAVSTI
ncbi:MAG: hypothetical protein WCO30_02695, partial [bacterium]